MKIAVCGTSCTGKSTYIQDFLKTWSTYNSPEKSYRDLIKEKNLPHSSQGTEDSQRTILNNLVDQAIEFSKKDNIILDRCVLDNMVYTSWLFLKEKVSEKFLEETRIIVRETLKLYDIIFFVPLTRVSPINLEESETRETDQNYREEIDNIFKSFMASYHKGDGKVFPSEDCPAMIEIFGSQEERIKLTQLYLTETGQPYGEDQSLLTGIV
jgi:deoxyadenosine/deoxycytidine kinase